MYLVTFHQRACVSVLSLSFHLLDISQGEWRLCFWEMTVYPACLDDAWRSQNAQDHLGPAASANHTDTSSPRAEMLIFSPWGGQRV